MDSAGDVMIAYHYNGERLAPDHGFPVRVIIPGWIGGRMVKWLTHITVKDAPSENYYHFCQSPPTPAWLFPPPQTDPMACADDNRIMPPHVDADLAKAEGWWFKPENLFNELNINSAIASPAHEEIVPLLPGHEFHNVQGYAYTGGGRKITRVEVSYDSGATWHLSEVVWPELEHSCESQAPNASCLCCMCWCSC